MHLNENNLMKVVLVASILAFAFFLIKKIQLDRECERLHFENEQRRMRMEMNKIMNPPMHCAKVLECSHIKCTRGVHQFVAAKGCPLATKCPDFRSLIGMFYKDVCEYWDLKEQDNSFSQEHL